MTKRIAVLLLLLFATAAYAVDYERVLIPVFSYGEGAYGSFWITTVRAANFSESGIGFGEPVFSSSRYPGDELPDVNCTPKSSIAGFGRLCDALASPSGLIVYVPTNITLTDLQWDARVRDISHGLGTAGTQIPIVRENEFRKEIALLDIAGGSNFRSALRVYSYDVGAQLLMRIYDERLVTLVEDVLKLGSNEVTDGHRPMRPQFAAIGDLVAKYPQLAPAKSLTIYLSVLQPLVYPPYYDHAWAMVSITNNDTQQVTIVSPQ